MRSSIRFSNKLTMLSEMENESKFQILEYDNLNGATDVNTAFGLNVLKESGVKLKQIRIVLNESGVKLQSGVMSYMKGDINVQTKVGGVFGLGKKLITSKLTGETPFKPYYTGTGEIFLEPSFGYYALIELEDDEIIIDDGMFYACEDEIEVSVSMQKNISSSIFGNEGLFQTKLSGSGIVVLEIPVPENEIFKCILINDTLKVDGDFAILRTGNIEFSVEKSSKSVVGSLTNGEGLVNVYRGSGEVWLMPTKDVYNKIKYDFTKNQVEFNNDEEPEI